MSVSELARRSGISRQTVIRLERDKGANTNMNTIVSMARALEVPVDDLFFADDG
jgi:DNA-binding XRE family transcriptional regulator